MYDILLSIYHISSNSGILRQRNRINNVRTNHRLLRVHRHNIGRNNIVVQNAFLNQLPVGITGVLNEGGSIGPRIGLKGTTADIKESRTIRRDIGGCGLSRLH
jgi:hypothetical protein